MLVHDLHPDYFTTRWAAEQSIATLAVQHHHAHIAAAMLENGWLDREVLGVAWDGTGYGQDGTIWGGEFLNATATGFRRVAHLRPFVLPGGDVAVKQPWRVAIALVQQAFGPEAAARMRFPEVHATSVEEIVRISKNGKLWPITTSAGRLFDGVAALVLGIVHSQFEGQPAMLLEAACDLSSIGEYEIPLTEGEPDILDWRSLICDVIRDSKTQIPPGTIAMKFHRALANAIVTVASRHNQLPVVLAGGCFHNRVLTELVAQQFELRQQPLGLPGVIPINDGGLAAGQLAVAIARLPRGGPLCA
jgi:hydrogenase maturation protein HypF